MYLRCILLLALGICSHIPIQVGAFINTPPRLPPPSLPPNPQNSFKNKIQDLMVLTRVNKNLVPVTVLNLLNGVITNPTHIQSWITSPQYWGASIMIHLFTAGSMVLNDLYDIKIDAINNPTRPLVKGTITIKEAAVFTTILFSLYTYFGLHWLPNMVAPIWKFSLITVLIYTPILKRIPLVKNLACASIITATVPFVGLSINPTLLTDPDLITNWVPLTARTLFITSMFIELMLDISDREGDAKNGINTLPVLFGSQRVVWWLFVCLFINYIQCISLCVNPITGDLVHIMYGAVLAGNFPLFYNLVLIKRSGFSKKAIKEALFTTTISMMIYFLLYLIWIRFHY